MDIDHIASIRSSEINPKDKKDYRCAPALSFQNGSCMPLDILIDMASAYNNYRPKNSIALSSKVETLNPTRYKRYLVKEFQIRLDDICDSQRCWVKQAFINNMNDDTRKKLKYYTFRPKGPQGKFTWLNTINLNNVMRQYQEKFKDFKFLGAVPIDFDDLPSLGIKSLDFHQLRNNNTNRLGSIFNLDEHYKDGSHWVSMFSNLNTGCVYFFDSYGLRPDPRIRKFMRRIARFCESVLPKSTLDVQYNHHRHQYKNSECGVYSINFIVRLLNGETFEDITVNKTSDKDINKCRQVYFT